MEFEWDSRKAAGNLRKHKVTFEEASTVFGDTLSMTISDPDHSFHEHRFITIGQSSRMRLLIVATCPARGTYTNHQRANAYTKERTDYEATQENGI
jgi:hypothetical protein